MIQSEVSQGTGLAPILVARAYVTEQCHVLHDDRCNRRIGNQWIRHQERLEVMRPYYGVRGQPILTRFPSTSRGRSGLGS